METNNEKPLVETSGTENGDTYDEDSGDHIGFIDVGDSVPAQIAVVFNGYYYIFKIDSRNLIIPKEAVLGSPDTSTIIEDKVEPIIDDKFKDL